ncbi:hypothetical protein AeRB84_018301, partial [Aphanomyces euteiches]
ECRDICSDELVKCNAMVGGEGCIVEIDETSIKKKSKYNPGRHYDDCWLFGGVDRATGKWFGRLVFNDRSKETLSTIIKQHIKPGTLIISDKFSSYVSANERHTLENNRLLADMNYSHQWVNHTQTIEGVWEMRVKRHLKAMRGVAKDMIPELLDEYLWRSWFFPKLARDEQIMCGICQAISTR